MISYYLNRCIPPQCVVVGPEIISRLVNEVIFEMVDVRMYTDQLEHPWKVYDLLLFPRTIDGAYAPSTFESS